MCIRDRNGLPIGMQIIGRKFSEKTILTVAKAVETLRGGYHSLPQIG